MKKALKYKVGQAVQYVLNDSIIFSGVIIEAEAKRGLKPYTIKTTESEIKYANEEYLVPMVDPIVIDQSKAEEWGIEELQRNPNFIIKGKYLVIRP